MDTYRKIRPQEPEVEERYEEERGKEDQSFKSALFLPGMIQKKNVEKM